MPKRNLFQLPLNPEEAKRQEEVKDKLRFYKLKHKKHSLFEALEEIVEKAEANK